jgi:hypothetical protein
MTHIIGCLFVFLALMQITRRQPRSNAEVANSGRSGVSAS